MYLPDYDNSYKNVVVRKLSSHTSGQKPLSSQSWPAVDDSKRFSVFNTTLPTPEFGTILNELNYIKIIVLFEPNYLTLMAHHHLFLFSINSVISTYSPGSKSTPATLSM